MIRMGMASTVIFYSDLQFLGHFVIGMMRGLRCRATTLAI